jgi:hypothetical protein
VPSLYTYLEDLEWSDLLHAIAIHTFPLGSSSHTDLADPIAAVNVLAWLILSKESALVAPLAMSEDPAVSTRLRVSFP